MIGEPGIRICFTATFRHPGIGCDLAQLGTNGLEREIACPNATDCLR